MNSGNEILVTGSGIITALGIGKDATWDALVNKRSGIAPVKYLQSSHGEFPVGEVKLSNEEMRALLHIRPSTTTVRSSLLGIIALEEALEEAGIKPSYAKERIALISGITVGGMDQTELVYQKLFETEAYNDYIDLNDCGGCTEQIADYFNGFSSVSTIVTACSSAANALIMASNMLKTGEADIVVAGGCECLSIYHFNGFHTLMILDNELCKPFDQHRKGINLGEGAAYLVLETTEHAVKRGATSRGKLAGACNACDAFHLTASSPNGIGPYLAMKGAIENAGVKPSAIDYINAHGTGTPNNDLTEGIACMRLFDKVPPIASIKAFTGHTTSAAGAVEGVISLLALENNYMPVNLNFSQQMEELNFSPVSNPLPKKPLKYILSNSFGFGGNDSSIIFASNK